jgi:hypothetical protein
LNVPDVQKQFYIFSKDGALRCIESKNLRRQISIFGRDADTKEPRLFKGVVIDVQDNSPEPVADYNTRQVIRTAGAEMTNYAPKVYALTGLTISVIAIGTLLFYWPH